MRNTLFSVACTAKEARELSYDASLRAGVMVEIDKEDSFVEEPSAYVLYAMEEVILNR